MKLRGANNYSIGLDLGTGSVGWAAIDENRELLKFKGKPVWGSRLFPSASTAADTRAKRGLRRRYSRRRQRIELLQGFFLEEMQNVDKDFFVRLNQSRLLVEDREDGHADYRWPLFNDPGFNESDYYAKFPTIYHLRSYLMKSEEKEDLRLIYLALHNIVKHRGNFLHQDNPSLSSKNANVSSSARRFVIAVQDWCDEQEIFCPFTSEEEAAQALQSILEDKTIQKKGDRRDKLQGLFAFKTDEGKPNKQMAKAFACAATGYKADYSKIIEGLEVSSFALSDEEKIDAFLEVCPDSFLEVFDSLRELYSSFILMGILRGSGETISECKVKEYEKYGEDLKLLKKLVKEYKSKEDYKAFFRGAFYEDKDAYDPSKAAGYTRYNLGVSKSGSGAKPYDYEAFQKDVVKLFAGTAAIEDERYQNMMREFDECLFLRRLKTSDNGSIPFQLHLEEMTAIIEKQSKHYPFLANEKDKIQSLVTFRIPYYVGPLTTKNAAKNAAQTNRFAWSVRQEGKENEKIYPWNWDEVIDKEKSADEFIRRMTGTCTYINGAPVLPKCSLLYEEFCVLNELNAAKWTQDGDKSHRFSYDLRSDIFEELFKVGGGVSYARLERWLEKRGFFGAKASGAQGESGFVSKLSSYKFFKDLLGVEFLSEADRKMAEEIILWNTLFEDRDILKKRIASDYGDRLDESQIKKICRKRFSGWGKLSQEFLTGVKASTDNGPMSIMDILVEGDPNNSHPGRAMNLMEILADDKLGFEKLLSDRNKKNAAENGGLSIDELPGSPALRRAVNQAERIVDEIARTAGSAPTAIYIETTREEDPRNKGKRTTQRYKQIESALEAFKKEDPDLWSELKQQDPKDFADKRLALYFIQRGRSMYSGKPLELSLLSTYQIDHILPQSLIKDDSLENLALVLPSENQAKTDKLTLEPSVRMKMKKEWKALLDAGLIGKKKFNNLMRSDFSESQIKGFIARQLVETSQIVKFVQQYLSEKYPFTRVVMIKASSSAALKSNLGVVKCREANNYHHAHDAYIACCLGSFIDTHCAWVNDNPVATAHYVKKLLKEQKEVLDKTKKLPGSAGFFASGFMRDQVNSETGEIWEHSVECGKIMRTLDHKRCFITRMPFEDTGVFWDQTVYSPRHMKGNGIPLKKGLDPLDYGGYSREQYAYFFVYEVRDKKGKPMLEWAPVPVSIAARISIDPNALTEYAKELAESSKKTFVRITRKKILKYQLIESSGDRFYVTGAGEVRNAREMAFSQNEMRLVKNALAGDGSDGMKMIFEKICQNAQGAWLRTTKLLALDDSKYRELFACLSNVDQAHVIGELLSNLNGSKNKVDLSPLGKGAHVGAISFAYAKEMSNHNLVIIDVSATGMFEKKQQLEL